MMKWSLLIIAKPVDDSVFDDRHMTTEWTDFWAKNLKNAKKKILKILKGVINTKKKEFYIHAAPYLGRYYYGSRSQTLDGSKMLRLRAEYESGKKLLKMKNKDLDKIFVVGYGPKQWFETTGQKPPQ